MIVMREILNVKQTQVHVESPAGEKAALWWGAANRDPEVFADPDRFVVAQVPVGLSRDSYIGPIRRSGKHRRTD